METTQQRREWDNRREFYAERGGEGAVEVDFGDDWFETVDGYTIRYRLTWNPETGDVYAQELAPQGGPGHVILVGENMTDRAIVENALWLDHVDDTSRFVRNEQAAHEDPTSLGWAVERLRVGVVELPDRPDGVPPGLE